MMQPSSATRPMCIRASALGSSLGRGVARTLGGVVLRGLASVRRAIGAWLRKGVLRTRGLRFKSISAKTRQHIVWGVVEHIHLLLGVACQPCVAGRVLVEDGALRLTGQPKRLHTNPKDGRLGALLDDRQTLRHWLQEAQVTVPLQCPAVERI